MSLKGVSKLQTEGQIQPVAGFCTAKEGFYILV